MRRLILAVVVLAVAFAAGSAYGYAAGYKAEFEQQIVSSAWDIINFADSHGQQACVWITYQSTKPGGGLFSGGFNLCP